MVWSTLLHLWHIFQYAAMLNFIFCHVCRQSGTCLCITIGYEHVLCLQLCHCCQWVLWLCTNCNIIICLLYCLFVLSLSVCFNSHFPGGPGLAGTKMSPFWTSLELRVMEVAVTTGAIKRANLQLKCQSKCHQQMIIISPFQMPFLSPN